MPSGVKPACFTSRNSFTVRSDVKIEPGFPGCSSDSLVIASCGRPLVVDSVIGISLRSCSRSLGASLGEPQDGKRAGNVGRVPVSQRNDRGADGERFSHVVVAFVHRSAGLVKHPEIEVAQYDVLGTETRRISTQCVAGSIARAAHQLGDATYLCVVP